MHFLVHWTKEGRWDVLSENFVPTELRHEGALGLITYHNGKKYLGKIIKISAKLSRVSCACRAATYSLSYITALSPELNIRIETPFVCGWQPAVATL